MTLHSHPALHTLFETLGYTLGYALYRHDRNSSGDFLGEEQRWSIIAAAAIGALLGSRYLNRWEM